MIRVVVADDHHLVREGLRRFLSTAVDIEVLGEASTGAEAVELVAEHRPTIGVLDINMPELDGISATRRIRERSPETRVIILSAYDERRYVVEAVRAGASGYLLKTRDASHLMNAVRMVAEGHMVIDPDLVVFVAEELRAARRQDPAVMELTPKELEVLQQLASGATNREIGERLFVSIDTVKAHLGHISQKLGTSDRTAAVAEAFRRRLID
ncbi:MAG: response regulator transcription factor [Actinomycetota bacterium]